MDKTSTLTPMDIVAGLNFGMASELYQLVEREAKEGKISNIFDLLVDESCNRLQRSSSETSMQTESAGTTAREMLDIQTAALRQRYEKVLSAERASPQASMEERMLQYQTECDTRSRNDLESQMRHFRDSEALKIRLEESRKARVELEATRREMELEYERRLAASSDREKEAARQHAEKERQLEASQYEYRARMQRELDEMRMREQAAGKKAELDAQGAMLLEQRLRETQIRIETRERELSNREAEVDARARSEVDRARDAAQGALREQMEAVARERFQLKEDRDALEDSQARHKQLVDSAKGLKKDLRDALQMVAQKEDELDTKNRMVQRLEAHHKEDEAEYAALAAATGGLTRPQHLLKLVRQNAELQAKVAVQQSTIDELEADRNRLDAADSLLKRRDLELQQASDEAARERVRHAEELRDASAEVEALKRALRAEKTRAGNAKTRVEELEALLQEQRTLVARLGKLQPGPTGRKSSGAGLLNRPGEAAARLRSSLGLEDIETIFKVAANRAAQVQVHAATVPGPASTSPAVESAASVAVSVPTSGGIPAATVAPPAVSLAEIGDMVDARLRSSLQSFGRASQDSLPAYSPTGAQEPSTAELDKAEAALEKRRAQVAFETAKIEAELVAQREALRQSENKLIRERENAAAAVREAELAVQAKQEVEQAAAAAAAAASSAAAPISPQVRGSPGMSPGVERAAAAAERAAQHEEERRRQQEAAAASAAARQRQEEEEAAAQARLRKEKEKEAQVAAAAAAKAKAEAEAQAQAEADARAQADAEAKAEAAAAAVAAERAESRAEEEARKKAEEDKAAVQSARAKVLARRKQRAARETASSGPPPLPAEKEEAQAQAQEANSSRRLSSGQDETHDFDTNSVNSFEQDEGAGRWF